MKQVKLVGLYNSLSFWSLVDWLLLVYSYHWMPKWFFWLMLAVWILGDVGRGYRITKAEKDPE